MPRAALRLDPGQRVTVEPRGAAVRQRNPEDDTPRRALRGRRPACVNKPRRHDGAPVARPRRQPCQRHPRALRGPLRHRRRDASRDRPSPRPRHLGRHPRRQERRGAQRHCSPTEGTARRKDLCRACRRHPEASRGRHRCAIARDLAQPPAHGHRRGRPRVGHPLWLERSPGTSLSKRVPRPDARTRSASTSPHRPPDRRRPHLRPRVARSSRASSSMPAASLRPSRAQATRTSIEAPLPPD